MSCFKSSNNKFFNSPSRMMDGRIFTDYRPNHELNRHIEGVNDVKNTHEYRLFLSRNGESIMGKNQEYIFRRSGMNKCMEPYNIGTMLPEKTRVLCDQHRCKEVLVDENGFGQGREYVTNGKNKILDPLMEPEMKLDDNMCVSPFDNFNYYPVIKNYSVDVRVAVPGGGNVLSGGDPSVYQ